ncbi:xanthine permease [Roseomonas sp. SSH11]|uniref:Xanthine permease n=1 Tax=Pararoseomonas baculiformis TaxID=2820812 RepID=A0ABS4AA90_9PROT|nr:solute carrier family 23 protein [Pararoseomonas baculiformis]MBP0443898.1 xanthine permease [Pararoseomonas baculiformis]
MRDPKVPASWPLESRPPWLTLAGATLQHAAIMSVTLVFPLLVADAAGADEATRARYLDLAMLALGVGTLLQAWRWRGIGSGFLIPAVFTAAYVPPALLAARTGGLGAVAAMTIAAGIAEMLLSTQIRRLRAWVPAEVMGIVVLLIGLILGLLGFRLMLGIGHGAGPETPGSLAGGVAALAVVLAVTVWGNARLRPVAALCGLAAGTALTFFLDGGAQGGGIPASPGASFISWPVVLPDFTHGALLPGFLMGALACLARASGDIVTAQRANDPNWTAPDFEQIRRGTMADGLGTLAAGLLGVPGLNTYSASIGLAVATRILARRVGIAVGLFWCAMALLPGTAGLVLAIPRSVLGATLLFSAAFVVAAGMGIVAQRLLDARRTATIGLAVILGLSYDLVPQFYARMPGWLGGMIGSSLVLALLTALLLNALFRIGTASRASLSWNRDDEDLSAPAAFILEQGRRWGAVAAVVERAAAALEEFAHAAPALAEPGSAVEMEASWDELALDLRLRWQGKPLPEGRAEPGEDPVALALAVLRHRAGRLREAGLPDGRRELRLRFEA